MSNERPIYEEQSLGRGGMTELQCIAYSGNLEWLLKVLQAGMDVNAVDHGGMSALHRTGYRGICQRSPGRDPSGAAQSRC
jgi:hypothetical protein